MCCWRITVTEADRHRIQRSRLPVISRVYIEGDYAPVVQTSLTAEVRGIPGDGETSSYALYCADTGRGVAKCKMTESAAVIGLSDAKPEGDFIPLIIEGTAAIDVWP